jgi:hypothetical protein
VRDCVWLARVRDVPSTTTGAKRDVTRRAREFGKHGPERKIIYIPRAQVSKFLMKTETESSLRNEVFK